MLAMRFSLTTWNINSVRLRIDLVAKFLKSMRPDVLCLQETKCIDDAFPLKRLKRLGYEHVALNGQKGYHGVAVISKLPFETTDIRTFCDNIDSRHISVAFGAKDLQLRQWTVTDPQGFDTTVAVYNLDTTKKPDPEMFKITYPDRPDPR